LYVTNESDHSEDEGEDDAEVPEEIETVLEDLFQGLQDRVGSRTIFRKAIHTCACQDTVVRWSAAKGVARISERLPREFTRQVVDTVIGLFSIHTIAFASLYDMPAIAESTWHGACLSCAELLRRGLIPHDRLADVIDWMIKVISYLVPDAFLTLPLGLIFRYPQRGALHRFQCARRCCVCAVVSAESLRGLEHRTTFGKTCKESCFGLHLR
jgi:hypothetical protein